MPPVATTTPACLPLRAAPTPLSRGHAAGGRMLDIQAVGRGIGRQDILRSLAGISRAQQDHPVRNYLK